MSYEWGNLTTPPHVTQPITDPLSRATPYSNIALELWRFCFFVGDNGVNFIFLFKFLASSSTPSAALNFLNVNFNNYC
ncbi:hypothetical protein RIR_jg41662.t1 [Rhizophagus irregularis DAOM 181602=DAOM 197198]|nr:hypothetical protein RIR_jg41662.t1 [Rhizophagus irregularis DAOM 181602=DAOM 197198]